MSNCASKLWAPILCLFVHSFLASASAQTTKPGEEEIARAAIAARLEALQNISVEYRQTQESFPQGPKVVGTGAGGQQWVVMRGPLESDQAFAFLHGCALWESTLSKEAMEQYRGENVSYPFHVLSAYRNGRLEFVNEKLFEKQSSGAIDKGCATSLIEVGLGLKATYDSDPSWLTAERLQKMSLEFNGAHQPVCTEAVPDGKSMKWTFLPDHGYALGRYEIINPPGVPNAKPYVITASEFKTIENVALPFSVVLEVVRQDGSIAGRLAAAVKSYKVNDPANVDARFSLKWPKGVEVHDRRTNSYVRTTEDDQTLDDITVGALLEKQENDREQARKIITTTQPAAPAAGR